MELTVCYNSNKSFDVGTIKKSQDELFYAKHEVFLTILTVVIGGIRLIIIQHMNNPSGSVLECPPREKHGLN